MVQELLSSMDSDSVSSISDTEESYQVALLLRGVYYDLAVELQLPEHEGLFELDASGDSNKPTLMTIPSEVVRLDSVKYDNIDSGDNYKDYKDVEFVPFNTFLEMQTGLRTLETGVGEMDYLNNTETFEMMYRTDRDPLSFTTVDDYTLLFDAYDSTKETTLQKAKTQCYGSVYTTFTLTDAFAPDLDPTQFAYFRNRAKVRAFAELKQVQNTEAALEMRNQKRVIQDAKRRVVDEAEVYKVGRFGRPGRGNYAPNIPKRLRSGS